VSLLLAAAGVLLPMSLGRCQAGHASYALGPKTPAVPAVPTDLRLAVLQLQQRTLLVLVFMMDLSRDDITCYTSHRSHLQCTCEGVRSCRPQRVTLLPDHTDHRLVHEALEEGVCWYRSDLAIQGIAMQV
jgi:hypothetical protein